ncbi:MAG: hypothetical protein ACM3VV_07000 [Deltaproteobacteria bacterium]
MNRINSLIILAAITLSTFLLFNTTTTTPITQVSAEPKGYENEKQSYDYLPEGDNGYPPMMNGYYREGLPMAEGEYNPDRYGGYYGHYESEFYLDQYFDGNRYGDDSSNSYENGSPYIE